MLALEVANRIGSSPFMVMQNMHIIQGRPSWSSSFIIASINACGRFEPIRYEFNDLGNKKVPATIWEGPKGARKPKQVQIEINDIECYAYTYDSKGKMIKGPKVSCEMAVQQGWWTKNDSKWPVMTELMLSYRAAAFFGRLHCPEILMGMKTQEEIIDINDTVDTEHEDVRSQSLIESINAEVQENKDQPSGKNPKNEEPSNKPEEVAEESSNPQTGDEYENDDDLI